MNLQKAFLVIAIVVLVAVTVFSLYSYFDLKGQKDAADKQAEFQTKLDEARLEGYLLSGEEVITAINQQLINQGFVSLPIQTQDGNFVQVKFYTEQQCTQELQRIIQEAE